MKYLFFTSVSITILLSGCQSLKPKHLSYVSDLQQSKSSLPIAICKLPTPFSSPEVDKALFKASMDIRKHHLTGLVFIKKIPDTGSGMTDSVQRSADHSLPRLNTYRLIFCNEFGMTYFDLETGSGYFHVNYCFEPLNKKILWKILQTDFRLLFRTEENSAGGGCFVQDSTNYLVYKNKQANLTRWDLYSSLGDTLIEVRGRSTFADKTMITFGGHQNEFPSEITIVNALIKLQFSLSLISIN